MNLLIGVEDEAWRALPGLDGVAAKAVTAALQSSGATKANVEVAVLFTDDASMAGLNAEWRGKEKPTNVLSFPAPGMPVPDGEAQPLGDIALGFGTVAREAAEQGKTLHDHALHLIVHGMLHLLGHDHDDDAEAFRMEELEIGILKGLGVSNPYER
jgi:probable rRNA maturation factor